MEPLFLCFSGLQVAPGPGGRRVKSRLPDAAERPAIRRPSSLLRNAWARVSQAMLAEVPIEEFLDLVAETAATLTGHPFAAVMLLDEEETRLVAKGAAGLTRAYVERLNSEFPVIVGGDAPASRAFGTGE